MSTPNQTKRSMSARLASLSRMAGALALCTGSVLSAHAGTIPASEIPSWAQRFDVPANSQVGSYHGQMSCTLAGGLLGKYKIDYQMTGGVPVNAGAMQPVYVGDGRATITIPKLLVSVMCFVGGKQIAGLVDTVNMVGKNSIPAVVNAAGTAGLTVPPTLLPASGDLVMTVPGNSTLQIGPFTSAGGTASFGIGAIKGNFNLLTGSGKKLLGVQIACAAPNPTEWLFNVVFGGESDGSPLKLTTHIEEPKGLPLTAITAATSLNYRCNMEGVGTYDVVSSLSASGIALVFKVNQSASFLYNRAVLHIPPQAVNDILAQTPNAATAKTSITNLEMTGENVVPAVKNALNEPVAAAPVSLVAGQGVDLYVPGNGGAIEPITFTAGNTPGDLHVYLGRADAVIGLYDANDRFIRSINVGCPARQPRVPLFPGTVVK